jgi:hypothetical protein
VARGGRRGWLGLVVFWATWAGCWVFDLKSVVGCTNLKHWKVVEKKRSRSYIEFPWWENGALARGWVRITRADGIEARPISVNGLSGLSHNV